MHIIYIYLVPANRSTEFSISSSVLKRYTWYSTPSTKSPSINGNVSWSYHPSKVVLPMFLWTPYMTGLEIRSLFLFWWLGCEETATGNGERGSNDTRRILFLYERSSMLCLSTISSSVHDFKDCTEKIILLKVLRLKVLCFCIFYSFCD